MNKKQYLLSFLCLFGLAAGHLVHAMDSWFDIPRNDRLHFYNDGEPYYEFTNFVENYPVTIDGKTWPTTEHYYQACKFDNEPTKERIRKLKTARDVFDFAQKYKDNVRKDWQTISLPMMEKAVRAKFDQHESLRNLLLSTTDFILVENAGKNDDFYGAGADGKGKNHLGQILMHIRAELQGKYKKGSAYWPATAGWYKGKLEKMGRPTPIAQKSNKNALAKPSHGAPQKTSNWFEALSKPQKALLISIGGSIGIFAILLSAYKIYQHTQQNRSTKRSIK